MLMTREEAAQKLCPLSRLKSVSYECIADRCAIWRWVPITNPSDGVRRFEVAANPTARTEQEAGIKPEHCQGWEFSPCWEYGPAGWVEPATEADRRRLGYCGLAGKP